VGTRAVCRAHRNHNGGKHEAGRDQRAMSAAAGVGRRSLQVISPARRLRPMVQMATGAPGRPTNCSQAPLQLPQKAVRQATRAWIARSACFQPRFIVNPLRPPRQKARRRNDYQSPLPASQESEDAGPGFSAPLIYNHQGSGKIRNEAFSMISGQGRALLAQVAGALAIADGCRCGDNYRPTVTPV